MCIIPDCGRPRAARGLCAKHYQNWRAHPESVSSLPPGRASGPEHHKWKGRFEDRYEKDANGCWLWKGPLSNGYGSYYFEGRAQPAHRASWKMAKGPIPKGMFVLHICDVRPCVNPEHLFLGTQADNMADMVAKGRASRSGARIVGGNPLSVECPDCKAPVGVVCTNLQAPHKKCRRAHIRRLALVGGNLSSGFSFPTD